VTLDDSDVPVVDYGYVGGGEIGGGFMGGVYVGPQRNPITISQHALSDYTSHSKTQDQVTLQKFINKSDWLAENAISEGNYSILQYEFPWPTYDIQPPWQSGMAQARALEVLAKAYNITQDRRYLETTKILLNSFFVEVKEVGSPIKPQMTDGGTKSRLNPEP
jgi:heparosan-N-sulfate-glucuronate 5-epimerase